MNTETSGPETTPPPPAELQGLQDYLRKNGLRMAVTVGLGLATVIGVALYRAKKAEGLQEAAQILNAARTAKDLETVLKDHASTPYAPLAALKLAKSFFNAGDYDQALNQYLEFKRVYPIHPMVEGAELGRIYCLEAKGQLEEALKSFSEFSASRPDHFLASQALFGQARCLEQLGRHAEAKTLYEDFIAAHPKSGWLPKAREMLALAVKKSHGGVDESDSSIVEKADPKEAQKPVPQDKPAP